MKSRVLRLTESRATFVLPFANRVKLVPRYYFDVQNGNKVFSDDEGTELPTIEAAQEEAVQTMADMARDAIRKNPDGSRRLIAMEVRDDNGPVLQVEFHWTVDRYRQS